MSWELETRIESNTLSRWMNKETNSTIETMVVTSVQCDNQKTLDSIDADEEEYEVARVLTKS